jgi:hypothetical protein
MVAAGEDLTGLMLIVDVVMPNNSSVSIAEEAAFFFMDKFSLLQYKYRFFCEFIFYGKIFHVPMGVVTYMASIYS